jgi:hypothetical protein
MRVGLSWISLDSLVRIEIFQWVTRLEAGKTFRALFRIRSAGLGARGRGHAEAQDCSWGKLNLFSDFLQELVARYRQQDDKLALIALAVGLVRVVRIEGAIR